MKRKDTEDTGATETVSDVPENEIPSFTRTEFYRDIDSSDDEPISLEMETHVTDAPQPLFSEVDLTSSNQNVAVFIEDSDDDVDLFVQRGGYTNKSIPFTHEIKVLTYPSFYCGLLLITITKLSTLAFWILLPFLIVLRLNDHLLYKTVLLLSIGGLANMGSVIACHWLPKLTARNRKIVCITSSFIASGGLFLLSVSHSLINMTCACILLRLGTGGVTNAFRHVLKDAMGDSEVIKTQTLLHILNALLIMLGMLLISSEFETTFKILAGIYLCVGVLWGLQPIFNRLCFARR
ncbi:hypothetical protein L9F63_003607 [Diploptera punctata]|uniref:Uncharacterized protein n=1 Tax=Diploptera punctata TaxID=6984 RepID=A0AAD7ZJQ7_DIPPU|nr:hypothetical protein L9F63_003607 [Diploptera punctata]